MSLPDQLRPIINVPPVVAHIAVPRPIPNFAQHVAELREAIAKLPPDQAARAQILNRVLDEIVADLTRSTAPAPAPTTVAQPSGRDGLPH